MSAAGTPNLWRLTRDGSVASMAVKAVGPKTCPADGWLTVSSGRRAAYQWGCVPPRPEADGPGAVVPGFAGIAGHPMSRKFQVTPGLLGGTVRDAGGCVAAGGPEAALGAADPAGRVAVYSPDPDRLDLGRCPVSLVALPGVTSDDGRGAVTGAARTARLREADRMAGRVLARAPRGATVLVAGIADDGAPRLRVAIAAGPAYVGGNRLTTVALRREGLVLLPDLGPTLLAATGLDVPRNAVGAVWRHTEPPARAGERSGEPPAGAENRPAEAVDTLAGEDVMVQTLRWLTPRFFTVLVALQLLFYLVAYLALRRRCGPRARLGLQAAALAVASVPASAYLCNLLPWWKIHPPALGMVAAVAGWTALIVTAALAGPWRRWPLGPVAVVAAVTAGTLIADVALGLPLQLHSVMGYSPLVGGRYYGFGNIPFAVYATSVLLLLTAAAELLAARGVSRRILALGIALVGLGAVLFDGLPALGADFGGVIALVPAVGVLAYLVAGIRVGAARMTAMIAVGTVLVLTIAGLDHLQPPDQRTHLGTFYGQILDGSAPGVVWRKAYAMLKTFGNFTLTPIVAGGLVFIGLVLLRPERLRLSGLAAAYRRLPLLRAGLMSVFTMGVLGTAVNDSGVAVIALTLTIMVPAALVAVLRCEPPDALTSPVDTPGGMRYVSRLG
ncbi:MAG: hypothetical protein GEV11_11495 [Streptosporangiales bacterium]|nr:hypothetical protein [Streptosporangiales bacterium]